MQEKICTLLYNEHVIFIGKVILLMLYGFLLGEERERSNKVIGARSTLLVLLGAFMFSYMSTRVGGDPSRIIAQIVSGVGFIGAGIIFKNSASSISNLTTAILIWTLSAIACLVALGFIFESLCFVALTYFVLRLDKIKSSNNTENNK